MNTIEKLIFLACLCLPIWMGEVIDYVQNIEDLFEVLDHEDQILRCLEDMM
jgi:hypothetical protein